AVIGQTLATRLKWKVGDRVPLTSPIWPNKSGNAWQFDIVGIFDDAKSVRNRSCFLFRYDYFDEARERVQGQVGWYQVRVNDTKHAPDIAKAIDAESSKSLAETKTETEAAMFQGFAKQIGDIG